MFYLTVYVSAVLSVLQVMSSDKDGIDDIDPDPTNHELEISVVTEVVEAEDDGDSGTVSSAVAQTSVGYVDNTKENCNFSDLEQ